MDNSVSITLFARDMVTPRVTGVADNVTRLFTTSAHNVGFQFGRAAQVMGQFATNAVGKVKNLAGGLFNTITSPFKSLIAQYFGAQAAVNTAISIFRGSTDAVNKAGELQLSTIATAQAISTNMGLDLSEGRAHMKTVQKDISKWAAELPGNTELYQSIYQGVAITTSKAYSKDRKAFDAANLQITRSLGVMATLANVTIADAQAGANKLLSGSSGFEEASQNDIVQKNSMFKDALIQEMGLAGISKEDWKTITDKQRVDIVAAATKRAAPMGMINAMTDTVPAMIESINSAIFDPISGAFGLLREVGTKDNRTGMDAIKKFLTFYSTLFTQFGAIAQKMGINTDPMDAIIGVIDWLTNLASSISISLVNGQGISFDTVGAAIQQWFKGLLEGIVNFDRSAIGNLLISILNGAVSIIANIPWTTLVMIVFETFWLVLESFANLLLNGQFWLSIVTGLGTIIGVFIRLLAGVVGGLIASVGHVVLGILNAVKEVVLTAIKGYLMPANTIGTGVELVTGKSPVDTVIDGVKGIFGMGKSAGEKLTGVEPVKAPDAATPKTDDKKVASSFAPVINVNGAGVNDPKQLASMVMDEMASLYSSYTMAT